MKTQLPQNSVPPNTKPKAPKKMIQTKALEKPEY